MPRIPQNTWMSDYTIPKIEETIKICNIQIIERMNLLIRNCKLKTYIVSMVFTIYPFTHVEDRSILLFL